MARPHYDISIHPADNFFLPEGVPRNFGALVDDNRVSFVDTDGEPIQGEVFAPTMIPFGPSQYSIEYGIRQLVLADLRDSFKIEAEKIDIRVSKRNE